MDDKKLSTFYQWQNDDLLLHCHLQPKASQNEFAGVYNQRLKIRLTAPPIDGKANQYLQVFIGAAFGVAKSAVVIIRCEQSRQKSLLIRNPQKIPAQLTILTDRTYLPH